jgi:hypothetical protein
LTRHRHRRYDSCSGDAVADRHSWIAWWNINGSLRNDNDNVCFINNQLASKRRKTSTSFRPR